MLLDSERASILRDTAAQVVNEYVDLSVQFSTPVGTDRGTVDTVYTYVCMLVRHCA